MTPSSNQLSNSRLLTLAALAFVLIHPAIAPAQVAAPADSGSGGSSGGNDDVVRLGKVTVNGDIFGDSILPTRASNSAFGINASVLDTPRSVYEITPEQLANDPIVNIADIARYAPSVNNYTSQGGAGAPYIRGVAGEVYNDGIRVSRSLHPLDTNAFQAADVVNGPASVVYGPSTKTSGYVNWIDKLPSFDGLHIAVNATLGGWDSDRDYPNFNGQWDVSGPVSKNVAYRASFEEQHEGSFFEGQHNNFTDLYTALSWRPNGKVTVDWNAEEGDYNYSDIRGWNRNTQQLIDHGIYTGGVATPVFKSPTGVYYEPTTNNPSTLGSGTGFIVVTPSTVQPDGSITPVVSNYYTTAKSFTPTAAGTIQGFVLRPINAVYSKLSPTVGIQNPADNVHVNQFITHLDVSDKISDHLNLLNKSSIEYGYVKRQTLVDAAFQGDNGFTVENRTELQYTNEFRLLDTEIKTQSNTGFSFRDVNDTSVVDTSNYFINPFDLTQGISDLSLGSVLLGLPNGNSGSIVSHINPLTGVAVSPGYGPIKFTPYYSVDGISPGVYSNNGASSVHSSRTEFGLFSLHEFDFGNVFTWIYGLRGTLVVAHVSNPVLTPVGGIKPAYTVWDNTSQLLPNLTNSFIYKPTAAVSFYVTTAYVQAINTGSWDGLTYSGTGGLSAAPFHSGSTLYETGSKFDLIPNRLSGSVSVYKQDRALAPSLPTATSPEIFSREKDTGAEAALSLQASREWQIGSNWSYLQGNYENYNPNSGFSSPWGVVANGTTVFSSTTNGAYPKGNYRVPIPRERVNLFTTYTFATGLGFRADFWATTAAPRTISWGNTLHVPGKYNINLGTFYTVGRWRFSLDVLNATNQLSFAFVNGDTAENVQPLELLGVRTRVSYRF